MKLLVGLLLLSVCHGYMYLSQAGNSTTISTVTLRGRVPGNIWSPPKKGGNRIPCGGKGNTAFVPGPDNRLGISAGQQIRIVGKLTMPADDTNLQGVPDLYQTPFVEVSIKYGNKPNYQMTRGFTMSPVWAPEESGYFQLIRNAPQDALNNNATIQVAFHISEKVQYFQCIDVWVMGGSRFPAGDFPWGKGPDDQSFDLDPCVTDCGIVEEGVKGSTIAIIILAVLCGLVLAVIVFFCCTGATKPVPVDDSVPPPQPLKVPQEPAIIEKPEPVKQVPPPEKSKSKSEDSEPIGHVIYTPADVDESDPTPQESSEQKSLDATGSQGRHFHFRYVEEDDDDGAKEEVV